MGLLGMLAALPLAPVKGLVGLARHLQEQAEREQEAELAKLQAMLLELEFMQVGGEEEIAAKEAELLERMGVLAGTASGGEET
jgi:hypothetical protein